MPKQNNQSMAVAPIPVIGLNTCEADITANCLIRDTNLQIFIGLTPITNPFPVTTTDSLATLQASITAATIGVGVTITVQPDSVFPLTCGGGNSGFLHLVVQVASTTQITDSLIVTDSDEGYNVISVTPFTCNLTPTPRGKKKRGGFPACSPYMNASFVGSPLPSIKSGNCVYSNPVAISQQGNQTIYRYQLSPPPSNQKTGSYLVYR